LRVYRLAAVAIAICCAAALGGCSLWSRSREPEPPAAPVPNRPPAGLEASLRSVQSGVTGKVRVLDRGDGVTLLLSMINLPVGEYRVSFNERANCTSPNAFSAGAPWAPAGAGKDARNLVGPLYTNMDGTAEAELHLRGVHTTGPDGVADRSVVIYTGRAVTDAQPDVPNNRIACGTFKPAEPYQF
jgi:Cu/Zn superoxide dismutase